MSNFKRITLRSGEFTRTSAISSSKKLSVLVSFVSNKCGTTELITPQVAFFHTNRSTVPGHCHIARPCVFLLGALAILVLVIHLVIART